jgi:D-glycero-D-manno-heptose 1,7-bisphosphate phosphatase
MTRYSTVFLDRDGTINVKAPEGEYVSDPDEVVLLPGAAEAIRRLNVSGRFVVVVSNQRGVARGRYTDADVQAVTDRITRELADHGAHVDAWYYCPHAEGECDCRKPLPGLLLRAAAELDAVDLSDAVLVGDAESDLGAAAAAGIPAVKLGAAPASAGALAVVPDLAAAVDLIVS